MATESLWCLVCAAVVERVVDDGGRVSSVVCPEYDERNASCRLRAGALTDAALAQLVEHVPDHPLDHPAGRCLVR